MNMKNILLILALLSCVLSGCKEEPVLQQPVDSVAPGPVSNVTVTNIPGGALLNYTLPDDEDLLFVKAGYSRKAGEIVESRSSIYGDTLRVEGFGDTIPREVNLIAVDRSRNESAAIPVTVSPMKPYVTTIGGTLDLVSDFGGVHAYWDNRTRAEVSVTILQENSNMEYVPIETFYSSMANGSGAIRGMDTVPGKFGLFVQDHWENRSEVKYFELTPIYETLFDRTKFRDVCTSDEDVHYGGGWVLSNIWDGTTSADQGYSSKGGTGIWPQSVTIDLGVLGQVSRIRLYQRMGNYTFAEGNPRLFEVWGSETLDPSGNWDSWTKLMDCESIKPSGLPLGQNSNEDVAVATNGEDFINSPMNPKVRFIRLKILRTWAGGDNWQTCEIAVYGDNR
jgi:hypothetical protein